jgi:hypothetical protein
VSDPGLFLSEAELEELTGYRRAHEQKRWLAARRWKFEENAAGKPRVARAFLERRLVGEAHTADPTPAPRHNFGALHVVK